MMKAMRWVVALVVSGCTFQLPDPGSGPDPTPTSPNRRIQLTFANAARREALVDFPVMVALDATRIDYAALSPTAADLRFADADGAALPYEIERWVPGGRSIVWVRVPVIDASDSDFIYLTYGDPSATDGQRPSAVWSSEHVGVWHLAEDPGPTGTRVIRDSTEHANDGTAATVMASSDLVDGVAGNGLYMNGSGGGVQMAGGFALATYTFALWVRGDNAPVAGAGNRQPISNGDVGFHLAWDDNAGELTPGIQHEDTGGWKDLYLGPNLSGGVWYHVAGTYDGAQLCGYRDGRQTGCVAAGAPLAPQFFELGLTSSNSATFQGRLDEVRVVDVARSPARIAAEHASELDQLVSYGTPEPF